MRISLPIHAIPFGLILIFPIIMELNTFGFAWFFFHNSMRNYFGGCESKPKRCLIPSTFSSIRFPTSPGNIENYTFSSS
jgi:hypothetical protein